MKSKKEKWLKEVFENETLAKLIEMRDNMKLNLINSKKNQDDRMVKALTRNLQIINVVIARKAKLVNV